MLWNVRRILQRGPAYRITRREQRSQRAMRDYRCIEYIQRVYTSVIFLFKQFYGSVLMLTKFYWVRVFIIMHLIKILLNVL